MSPGNYIRLSPGEEARLKHDENRKQKLARLQQVREQERILASEHRKLYQTVAESELGHVLNLLEKDWTASRRQKINQLKNVQDKQKQLLGQAHRTAELVAADEKAHNKSLYSTALDRIKLDVLRGQEALAETLLETATRRARTEVKRLLLKRTREKENLRALYIAESQQEKAANSAPDFEIPSAPLARPLQRRYDHFENTANHRHNPVVRCDVKVKTSDAWDDAVGASEEKMNVDTAQQARLDYLLAKTQQRSERAGYDVYMGKQRGILYKALDDLYIEDRRRKIQIVSQDASRPTRMNPDVLARRFEQMFDLEQAAASTTGG